MKNDIENKRKNGNRYCKICGEKLYKNGHDRYGKQRWICKGCIKTMRLKDDRQEKIKLVRTCLEWILTKLSAKNIEKFYGISRSTFYRKKKQFFKILPELASTGEVYDCVLVDGTHVKNVAFLIAKTPEFVISSVWSEGETVEAYEVLLGTFPEPRVIVCDGGQAIDRAINKTYEKTRIQRCFVHLLRYVRTRVSINPKTPGRRCILKLTKQLFNVKTKEEAEKWNQDFDRLYNHYKKQINAFHKSDNPNIKKKYWDDRQLHYSWNHIKYAKDKSYLWTFLDFPKGKIPRNTNSLEGGVNSNLKQLNFCHRGMRADEERIMFGWDLVRKSEFGLDDFLNNIKIKKTPQGQPFTITIDT